MLPIAAGAGIGFFLADRGMRLLPTMLELTLAWVVIALGLIATGRWLSPRMTSQDAHAAPGEKLVIIILVLAAVGVGAQLLIHRVDTPTALTGMSKADFDATFDRDAARYAEIDQSWAHLLTLLSQQNLPPPGKETMLTPTEEQALRQAWHSVLNQAIALDQIRRFHEDYWRFDPSRSERSYHLRSFLLTFAAELALYEKGVRFSNLVETNPNAKNLLDAPHPELGLDKGSYSLFRKDLLGVRDQARVVAGSQYLSVLRTGFQGKSESRSLGVAWLWERCEDHLATIDQLGAIDRTKLSFKADKELLKKPISRFTSPATKGTDKAMGWVGDAKVRRPGWYLINAQQHAEMDPLLQPGDILLSRKNWYLSNVPLPGFWPHALIYLGSPEKFEQHFDDPAVTAWATEQAGHVSTLGQLLAQRYPTQWLKYQVGPQGDENRVIEAVSDGVIFNTMNHAAGDYLAALRPRLDKVAKAKALMAAFSHAGKPYDFEFDFATDHAVVCTELVWRAYRPESDKAGVELPVINLIGRRTMPANEIAKMYDVEAGTAEQTLDFILFYDGMETEGRAISADEKAFRTSWRRPKWDVAQK